MLKNVIVHRSAKILQFGHLPSFLRHAKPFQTCLVQSCLLSHDSLLLFSPRDTFEPCKWMLQSCQPYPLRSNRWLGWWVSDYVFIRSPRPYHLTHSSPQALRIIWEACHPVGSLKLFWFRHTRITLISTGSFNKDFSQKLKPGTSSRLALRNRVRDQEERSLGKKQAWRPEFRSQELT